MYWATSHPAPAAAASASPLAWPTDMAVRTLVWKNTRSTTTASGWNSSSRAWRSAASEARRVGSGSVVGVVMTPADTACIPEPPAPAASRTAP